MRSTFALALAALFIGSIVSYALAGSVSQNGGTPRLQSSLVANLPTCNASAAGLQSYVTNATSPTFLTAVVGGGAVVAPVFCNGSAWIAY